MTKNWQWIDKITGKEITKKWWKIWQNMTKIDIILAKNWQEILIKNWQKFDKKMKINWKKKWP